MSSIKPDANGSEINDIVCMRCGKRFSERTGHECKKAEKYAQENKLIKSKGGIK